VEIKEQAKNTLEGKIVALSATPVKGIDRPTQVPQGQNKDKRLDSLPGFDKIFG
jgi:hypothetical protein